MAGGESRLGMRVMYMISLNHGLAQKSITILHAYKLAENPRKPAQSRAFAHKDPRKFGLVKRRTAKPCAASALERAASRSTSSSVECVAPSTSTTSRASNETKSPMKASSDLTPKPE